MRGMQYELEGKGVLGVAGFGLVSSPEVKWKKEGFFAGNEPISVLDAGRSPSPSTTTSTLSSSFGGGGNQLGGGGGGGRSTDNTNSVAAAAQKNCLDLTAMTESSAAASAVGCGGSGGSRKEDWGFELQSIAGGMEVSGGERFGAGVEDWENLLSETGQDQSLLRWISGDVDDTSFSLRQMLQSGNQNDMVDNAAQGTIDQSPNFTAISMDSSNPNLSSNVASVFSQIDNNHGKSTSPDSNFTFSLNNLPLSLPPGAIYQQQRFEEPDVKPHIFSPQITQSQNLVPASLFNQQDCQDHSYHLLQPQPKRQNLGIGDLGSQIPKFPFLGLSHELLTRNQQSHMQLVPPLHHLQQKPMMVPKPEAFPGETNSAAISNHYQHQQQVVYDQLFKAGELIMAGNFSLAQSILARLNHQLSPVGKPFQRAAFYFKEALQLPLLMPNSATSPQPRRNPTAFDAMFKMGAYKAFSDVSPLLQFKNFTSNQAIIEALGDSERIHIIDFDIGFGAQWASFMQELPGRKRGTLSLKVTAFASPSTHHPLELALMHENLTQFAGDLGVNFELEVVNSDSFDPNSYTIPHPRASENEAVAVNFPIWSCLSHLSALPSLLHFIKQLSPKIVVSFEHGYEGTDVPFPRQLLHSLQYYEVLLDSIDAASVNPDIANRIERFLFQPMIESIVLGRLGAPEKLPHWKTLLASAGFSPAPLSSLNETQAEYLVKRTPGRGFHVEKGQGALVLCWQRRELMSASAWRC